MAVCGNFDCQTFDFTHIRLGVEVEVEVSRTTPEYRVYSLTVQGARPRPHAGTRPGYRRRHRKGPRVGSDYQSLLHAACFSWTSVGENYSSHRRELDVPTMSVGWFAATRTSQSSGPGSLIHFGPTSPLLRAGQGSCSRLTKSRREESLQAPCGLLQVASLTR